MGDGEQLGLRTLRRHEPLRHAVSSPQEDRMRDSEDSQHRHRQFPHERLHMPCSSSTFTAPRRYPTQQDSLQLTGPLTPISSRESRASDVSRTSRHSYGLSWHPHHPQHRSNALYDISRELMGASGSVPKFLRMYGSSRSTPVRPSFSMSSDMFHRGSGSSGGHGKRSESGQVSVISVNMTGVAARSTASGSKQANISEKAIVQYGLRKQFLAICTRLTDFALAFASVGVLLAVVESEFTGLGWWSKGSWTSTVMTMSIVLSTIFLCGCLISYHVYQLKMLMAQSGVGDFRVVIQPAWLAQTVLECAVCAVCPLPGTGYVQWSCIAVENNQPVTRSVSVPLDLLLSLPMFLRFYLLSRFMVLHSRLYQDAGARSIAALNRISVNFPFIMKTMLHHHPLKVFVSFIVAFWAVMAWLLAQCERYNGSNTDYGYAHAVWLILITFMSIGYGDIVPSTYCGRSIAVLTGMTGGAVASLLVAIITRKLDLAMAERHVVAFMADTTSLRLLKITAARVIQRTWLIYKATTVKDDHSKNQACICLCQRQFLAAINDFRKAKWEQGRYKENERRASKCEPTTKMTTPNAQNELALTLADIQRVQVVLSNQITILTESVAAQLLRSRLNPRGAGSVT